MKKLLVILSALFVFSCASTEVAIKKAPESKKEFVVKAGKFDTGKMWTFEHPPIDYLNEEFGLNITEDWLTSIRMAALQFQMWCSSSFVSADGLIMTNHHCVEFITESFQEEGENITKNGFYAETLEQERKVPNLFVDQLVLVKDITDEIVSVESNLNTIEEKANARKEKIKEIEKEYTEETGLICQIVELYNGGRYSLYGYRRYDDVRAVFIIDSPLGLYGGDPDNFTYPRYNLDFALVRAYENDKPVKTNNFFKFSTKGISEGEILFNVGRPGRTERLKTVAQLEFLRDYQYKDTDFILSGYQKLLAELIKSDENRRDELFSEFNSVSNSAKVYSNMVKSLTDERFLARKRDFEERFKGDYIKKTSGDISLWSDIENLQKEFSEVYPEYAVLNTRSRILPDYFSKALEISKILNSSEPDTTKRRTIKELLSEEYDKEIEFKKLALFADFFGYRNSTSEVRKVLFDNKPGKEGAMYAISNSVLFNEEMDNYILKEGVDLKSITGPFLKYAEINNNKWEIVSKRVNEIKDSEKVLLYELGRALYDTYGTTIPPDATSTLRFSEGVVKPYEYNGTIAPIYTTFYGLYDRYYSHQQEFPWKLDDKWFNTDEDFELSTPLNFVSTNDITGGSSGSPVINLDKEVVGLAFDGNIESISGQFIFDDTYNRTVAVDVRGILEALDDVYKAERIVNELKNGGLE